METIKLDNGKGNTCSISTFGSTLTSWTVNNKEMIFVSPNAVLDGSKAIRGGIPICFPAFGPWSGGPQHGFARSSTWLVSSPPSKTKGGVTVTLTLTDTKEIRKSFDHSFQLNYTVTLKESSIFLSLDFINKDSDKPVEFTTALHTYFKVPDVANIKITGLKGAELQDKTLPGVPTSTEERDDVVLVSWTDRVYRNTSATQVISGLDGGAKYVLTKTNLADTVVWNPFEEKAAGMGDLGSGNWPGFVCVEAGQCVDKVVVEPGQKWGAIHQIAYHL